MSAALCLLAVALALLATGCRDGRAVPSAAAGPPSAAIRFTDIAETSGVRFTHTSGATKRFYLAETMGSGCAFLDYDGDGRLDLFFVNSSRLPGFSGKGPFIPALYRNLGVRPTTNDQRPTEQSASLVVGRSSFVRFEDVTKQAGLTIDGYGMGVAIGDYDNDGDPDLYLTAYGGCRLFRNVGKGPDGGPVRFTDVTAEAGVRDPQWGTSAAFLDYDRDGRLDLFVCSYCDWSPERNQSCGDSSGAYICAPRFYRGTESVLYHNNGNGTFTDVTRKAGVDRPNGKALGVVVWDMDDDGWLDFAVANDTVPNWLFRNNRNGTFGEVSVEKGIAYSNRGDARAGMGIDTVAYDDSGHEALLIGNNSMEGLGFYRFESGGESGSGGHFFDVANEIGIYQASLPFSTFGALASDVDLDGFRDIVTANGHVNQQVARMGGSKAFEQRMQLFHNEPGDRAGTRRFREIGEAAGDGMTTPRVARGLAVGDVDGDGDPDLLISTNNGRAALLRNEGIPRNHWLAIRPRGVRSNRDGIGTRVTLQVAGRTQTAWVRSGGSYCSESEHVARFGLGQATRAEIVQLRWPNGALQTLRDVNADQILEATEAGG